VLGVMAPTPPTMRPSGMQPNHTTECEPTPVSRSVSTEKRRSVLDAVEVGLLEIVLIRVDFAIHLDLDELRFFLGHVGPPSPMPEARCDAQKSQVETAVP
jgi:hypothetical protein